jgi:hypothetical protein
MSHSERFRKSSVSFLVLGIALVFAQMACDASPIRLQEQRQSQSQQPPPSPTPAPSAQPASDPVPAIGQLPVKRRKVWTNDDVVTLRSPADNYEIEEEAKKAADAAAAAKEAAIRAAVRTEKTPPLDIKLPATVEETEKMLKDTQGEIEEETVVLNKMQKDLADTPAAEQAQKQKDIDRLTSLLAASQRDLKALQDHLQTLRPKHHEENPPATQQPPSV